MPSACVGQGSPVAGVEEGGGLLGRGRSGHTMSPAAVAHELPSTSDAAYQDASRRRRSSSPRVSGSRSPSHHCRRMTSVVDYILPWLGLSCCLLSQVLAHFPRSRPLYLQYTPSSLPTSPTRSSDTFFETQQISLVFPLLDFSEYHQPLRSLSLSLSLGIKLPRLRRLPVILV